MKRNRQQNVKKQTSFNKVKIFLKTARQFKKVKAKEQNFSCNRMDYDEIG